VYYHALTAQALFFNLEVSVSDTGYAYVGVCMRSSELVCKCVYVHVCVCTFARTSRDNA